MKLHTILAATIAATIAAAPAPGVADTLNESLTNAQGLYAQASYEQALALLERLDPKGSANLAEGQTIRRYRALCLIALGRSGEAERAVEDMVRADPAAATDEELPPRLQELVQNVRGRVVREVVRQGYEHARDLYGREQFAAAAEEFTRVIALLDDRALALTRDPGYADIRLLADGFVRLSKAAPVTLSNAAAPQPVAAPPVVNEEPPQVADAAFVAPVPIVQDVPAFPRSAGAGFMARREGDLDVDVAADGRVTGARIVSSIHPVYDVILSAAAKNWKYQPARRRGEPVPYTKRVHVVVQVK
jgi:tetratricopeptide (TPR) repeat protein